MIVDNGKPNKMKHLTANEEKLLLKTVKEIRGKRAERDSSEVKRQKAELRHPTSDF